jgi:hypothetical protein
MKEILEISGKRAPTKGKHVALHTNDLVGLKPEQRRRKDFSIYLTLFSLSLPFQSRTFNNKQKYKIFTYALYYPMFMLSESELSYIKKKRLNYTTGPLSLTFVTDRSFKFVL